MNIKSDWLIFPFIFASTLILYHTSLSYYFFQDDWFVLKWLRSGDFGSFLGFRTDIIYWRPLSMPLLFAFAKSIFGLNAFGFHLIAFLIFFLLIIAVHKLMLMLLKNHKLALSASFMYAIWPIHYISLSWLSTTAYIIGPLFQTLSFIFFVKFIEEKKRIFQIASFLLFVFGIASSEFTLVLPLIFLVWLLFFYKKSDKKLQVFSLVPFFEIILIYLVVRFSIFPIPARGDYELHFDLRQIFNNFIWYVAWALGLPESFKSLIFPSLPAQSFKIITQFWTITLPVFLLSLLLLKQVLTNFRKNTKIYVFGLLWFSIGLLPVIAITDHSFPMYLSFSGLGLLYITFNLFKKSNNVLQFLLIGLWLVVSYTNLQFTRLTHWIRNEQAISRVYVEYVREKITDPPPYSIFLFKPADLTFSQKKQFLILSGQDTLRQSLNNQDAMQVIFNDLTLQSFYTTHQQNLDLPKNVQIFEIVPH